MCAIHSLPTRRVKSRLMMRTHCLSQFTTITTYVALCLTHACTYTYINPTPTQVFLAANGATLLTTELSDSEAAPEDGKNSALLAASLPR